MPRFLYSYKIEWSYSGRKGESLGLLLFFIYILLKYKGVL
jgi:hypothetical protein